eukprot:6205244-Pleurochrysis_carterae.AAC.3
MRAGVVKLALCKVLPVRVERPAFRRGAIVPACDHRVVHVGERGEERGCGGVEEVVAAEVEHVVSRRGWVDVQGLKHRQVSARTCEDAVRRKPCGPAAQRKLQQIPLIS